MIRSTKFIASAFGLILMSGCTSLQTRPAYEQSAHGMALRGVEYSLPMLQYDVPVSYRIAGCGTANDPSISIAIATTAKPASTYVAGERYLIDYLSLSSPFKTSDFAIETYKGSGTLKSINATIEDKTADVVKSAVDLAISTAKLAATGGLPITPQAADRPGIVAGKAILKRFARPALVCRQETAAKVARYKALKDSSGSLPSAIKQDSNQIDQIVLRYKLGVGRRDDRRKLYEAQSRLVKNMQALADGEDELGDLEKELTFADDRQWPTAPSQQEGELGIGEQFGAWAAARFELRPNGPIDVAALRSELASSADLFTQLSDTRDRDSARQFIERTIKELERTPPAAASGPEASAGCQRDDDLEQCLKRQVALIVQLRLESAAPPSCAGDREAYRAACVVPDTSKLVVDAGRHIAHGGIFVRQPLRARLIICRKRLGCAAEKGIVAQGDWETAPQFGQLRFFPLTNGFGENNTLSVALREDGTLEKFQYASKSAIAAQVLATAASTASSVQSYEEQRQKDRKQAIADTRAEVAYQRSEAAAIRSEDLSKIQYDIDRLTKQKALLALQNPTPSDPIADETAKLDAQIALLTARTTLIQAQTAFGKASAPPSPQ